MFLLNIFLWIGFKQDEALDYIPQTYQVRDAKL